MHGFVWEFALVYSLAAILNAHYSHACDKLTLKIRAILINSIYECLLIRGQLESETTAITNLISVDVEAAVQGIRVIHEIWATLATTLGAMWLLYQQIGIA
jgi:ATP-binding cassette subfamily C (CFTR/MRP) protein 1